MPFRNVDAKNPPSRALLRARWILAIMGIIVAAQDVLEHILAYGQIDSLLWIKVGMYSVVFPVLGLALLRPLQKSEQARELLDRTLERQLAQLRQLSDVAHHAELTNYIIETPREFLPVEETALYLSGDKADIFIRAASWAAPGHSPTSPPEVGLCATCRQQMAAGLHAMPVDGSGWPQRAGWFSLPLELGSQWVGLLHLRLPEDYAPPESVARALHASALEMAFAVDRARLRDLLQNQAAQSDAARAELARDMHDVLGQNIAYLRMKLEDLSESIAGQPVTADLQRLTQIANESYTQVRQMLFELNNQPSQSFEQQLASLLQSAAQRCPINIRLEQFGKPFLLEEPLKRQALYILRETLNNIEKHVCGGAVWVTLDWGEKSLRMAVRDEGPGFDPAQVPAGHYGLQNMRERAEAVGGRVKISSAPGQGTQVELTV